MNEKKRSRQKTKSSSSAASIDQPKTLFYLYLCMEVCVALVALVHYFQLCSKHTLRDWLTSNTSDASRPPYIMLGWFMQIVVAVDYVHTVHRIVHRDLKPSNIFFAADGSLKVADFGLATITGDADGPNSNDMAGSSRAGSASLQLTGDVGTRLYMSPEQMAGVAYTSKVDIFSLALILVELLVPFKTHMQRVHVLESVRHSDVNDALSVCMHDMPEEVCLNCHCVCNGTITAQVHQLVGQCRPRRTAEHASNHSQRAIGANRERRAAAGRRASRMQEYGVNFNAFNAQNHRFRIFNK
jgi:serine/threonine protein kinase